MATFSPPFNSSMIRGGTETLGGGEEYFMKSWLGLNGDSTPDGGDTKGCNTVLEADEEISDKFFFQDLQLK